jgi:EAL domain-containing protein (putative c-di-GMP-specific phosphodiesterase class I)
MILSSALDRALVASVGTMTRAYGIHLLGTLEKPVTPERLQALLSLYRAPASRELSDVPPVFSLDEIRSGLAARQFEPYFQPKVDIASGKLKGVEALARWRHPEQGIVAPQSFIETLEGSGLIDELSWLMIELSARWCRQWRESDLDISVSVNISLSSLNKASFADRIASLVEHQGLDPRHMILEVTESTAMTHVGQALENLARLRIKGFGLSIDDYGTGYSSIQQLTRVSFTELKVDQSFVTDADTNETCRVVLETSLDMAKKLRLCSVAEGVESERDWALLQGSACNLAQGYLIGRPMEGKYLLDWVANWKPPVVAEITDLPKVR